MSRINADTVTSYYAADAKAVRLVQEFALGEEPELTAQVPMTDRQSLSIHVTRNEDSSLRILSWNVISSASEG